MENPKKAKKPSTDQPSDDRGKGRGQGKPDKPKARPTARGAANHLDQLTATAAIAAARQHGQPAATTPGKPALARRGISGIMSGKKRDSQSDSRGAERYGQPSRSGERHPSDAAGRSQSGSRGAERHGHPSRSGAPHPSDAEGRSQSGSRGAEGRGRPSQSGSRGAEGRGRPSRSGAPHPSDTAGRSQSGTSATAHHHQHSQDYEYASCLRVATRSAGVTSDSAGAAAEAAGNESLASSAGGNDSAGAAAKAAGDESLASSAGVTSDLAGAAAEGAGNETLASSAGVTSDSAGAAAKAAGNESLASSAGGNDSAGAAAAANQTCRRSWTILPEARTYAPAHRRDPASRKGVLADTVAVSVLANSFKIHRGEAGQGQGVYLYRVSCVPDLTANVVSAVIHGKGPIKDAVGKIAFDGVQAFLQQKLTPDEETGNFKTFYLTITPEGNSPDRKSQDVVITFTYVMDIDWSSPTLVQVLNILLRTPTRSIRVWPGYVTAISDCAGGLFMNIDVAHKITRDETALDVIRSVNTLVEARRELIGQVVMTE
ncbi:spidroin-1-like [Sycon ciliatum]|uniref:spidroin-1-like n=1 Tax=Sycon ciliatum TaxID=27933 RepID=UPI0031F716D8